ncbi:dehydratase [Caenimonas sedimenti]|uniref:Dehydratase n=1 Tax=Caenimonas sedimenti TaxID=2596921 RepID=A0A562ZSL3_9BURK|nr:MaoC family dehydratase [Caenimonas sedimenti]TWO71346.1 dehydratase [Caenimonas sedimenti]
MSNRSLDDLNPGDVFKSYGRTVTETDIVNFTCLAGLKLPIFINEEFARKHTNFGGRICPGLLTASIAAGMMEEILGPATIAALELTDFKFTVPVRPGDTLRAEITVEGKKELSDGKRGVMSGRVRVFNQRAEQVFEFSEKLMMRRGRVDDLV